MSLERDAFTTAIIRENNKLRKNNERLTADCERIAKRNTELRQALANANTMARYYRAHYVDLLRNSGREIPPELEDD